MNIYSIILINISPDIRARRGMLLRRVSITSTAHRGIPNGLPICRLFALQASQQGRDDLPNPREILVQRVW
jgi:hypothetical protein